MDALVGVVLFGIGTVVGGMWFVGIVLPLLHSLPRSIYWILKGRLKPRAFLLYIGLSLAWTGAFTVAVLIVDWTFPKALIYLYNSAAFFFGQWFGVLWYLAMSLSKSGRHRLSENFWDEMQGYLSAPIDSARSAAGEAKGITQENAERTMTPHMIEDLFSLPERERDIAGKYGEILAATPGPLRPLSKLPYPKETIREAIERLLAITQIPDYREALRVGLSVLDDFVPDEEISPNKEENTRKWMKARYGIEIPPRS